MSNEITASVNIQVTNGDYKDSFYKSISIDQTTAGVAGGIYSVTTSESNVPFTTITTNGVLCLQNLDDTNFILAGLDDSGTGKFIFKIPAGGLAYFQMIPSVNLRVKADTATCRLRFWMQNA